MKFAIDIGHNAETKDTGAVGIEAEDKLTSEVGRLLIALLKKAGHTVVETCPQKGTSLRDSLRHRVEVANSSNSNVFVSIHFNAFNTKAHGSEVFALSKAGAAIGSSILDEIIKLGYVNRGVKRAPFYVLRHTTMPAVLVECCFCDSEEDMRIYDPIKIARAVATGLIGELPGNDNEMRTLKISQDTWLKKSTEQAKYLPPNKLQWISQRKYQVLAVIGTEEHHHYVRLSDGSEWFVYAGHSIIE